MTIENVTDIADQKPHVTIRGISGNYHVCPVAMFQDVIDGKLGIEDVEQIEDILPVILEDWLRRVQGKAPK